LIYFSSQIFNAYLGGAKYQAGLSYDQVLSSLKQQGININLDQLCKGVAQLCEDGRLYTTIDDEHYKPTVEN
jgi:ribosomal protein L20